MGVGMEGALFPGHGLKAPSWFEAAISGGSCLASIQVYGPLCLQC